MSETFERAFRLTVMNPRVEGGFVLSNDATDPGGMTFAGISRRYHPRWLGWPLIDAGVPATDAALRGLVKQFYLVEFWQRINGENLPARIAMQVFDMAVNSDPADAARALQTAIGTVAVDGVIGPKTCAAAQVQDTARLLLRFFAQRLYHYTTKPSRQAWLDNGRGWTNRVALMMTEAAG